MTLRGWTSQDPSAIEIAHTGKVVLMDGSGGIRGYYDSDEMGLEEVFNARSACFSSS